MDEEETPALDPPAPLAPCPECGGECVYAQVPPAFGVQRVDAFFGGASRVYAVVCLTCGLTSLYAAHPEQVAPRN
jgi:hypothetical protein